MRYLFALFLAIFLAVAPTFAYSQVEFDDCISSSKENPDLENVVDESIEGFCDCALTRIFDENKIDNLWINACVRQNFY